MGRPALGPFHSFPVAAVRLTLFVPLVALCSGAIVRPMVAQAATTDGLAPLATRTQLESLAQRREASARQRRAGSEDRRADSLDAARIRRRLQEGDFRAGDQILLELVGGEKPLNDTLLVRSGGTLVVSDLPEISLAGILRAEVQDYLRTTLARYIREPQVRATPLTRLAVLGEVQRPGFYAFAADMPLSEVIMRAGGPTGQANLHKVDVRRGATVLYNTTDTRDALQRGVTLDQLDLRPGDELAIAQKRGNTVQNIVLPLVTIATGLSALLVALR